MNEKLVPSCAENENDAADNPSESAVASDTCKPDVTHSNGHCWIRLCWIDGKISAPEIAIVQPDDEAIECIVMNSTEPTICVTFNDALQPYLHHDLARHPHDKGQADNPWLYRWWIPLNTGARNALKEPVCGSYTIYDQGEPVPFTGETDPTLRIEPRSGPGGGGGGRR